MLSAEIFPKMTSDGFRFDYDNRSWMMDGICCCMCLCSGGD